MSSVGLASRGGAPLHSHDLLHALRTARNELGLSTRALAARVGVDCGLISKWEHGRCTPNIDNFAAWAGALGFVITLAKTRRHARPR